MAQYSQDLAPFLQASDIINFQHPLVARQAAALRAAHGPDALPQACFEFVRDQISHFTDTYAQPLPQIVTYLGSATNFQEASRMLPDGVSLP